MLPGLENFAGVLSCIKLVSVYELDVDLFMALLITVPVTCHQAKQGNDY